MKKLFTEAKNVLGKESGHGHQHQSNQQPIHERPSRPLPPTALDVLRYRYHHGTNIGSVFVLEQWLTPSMYPEGVQSSELAAVTGLVQRVGLQATRTKFEHHWENYISDEDLNWLRDEAHCKPVPPVHALYLSSSVQARPSAYR